MTDRTISRHWIHYQPLLFGANEQQLVTPSLQKLIILLDIIRPQDYDVAFAERATGRPPVDRIAMLRAFIAKAVLNIADTKFFIERLKIDYMLRRVCGFAETRQVPCEGTFSNVFREIAASEMPAFIHQTLIEEHLGERIHEHISRDATAIPAREKATTKTPVGEPAEPKKVRRKRGTRIPKRIELQSHMSLDEMITDLPKLCDFGTKTNAKGKKETWRGYKLHFDVTDDGIPVSAILTSASTHDSQAAIPLETMSYHRICSLYTLSDAAYLSADISDFVTSLGKVGITAPKKPKGGDLIPLDPPQRHRFKNRTVVERANARIKDDFAGTGFHVRGHAKIFAHLMFGIVALCAEQIARHIL